MTIEPTLSGDGLGAQGLSAVEALIDKLVSYDRSRPGRHAQLKMYYGFETVKAIAPGLVGKQLIPRHALFNTRTQRETWPKIGTQVSTMPYQGRRCLQCVIARLRMPVAIGCSAVLRARLPGGEGTAAFAVSVRAVRSTRCRLRLDGLALQ
jgi:hypothetical protein